MTNYLRVYDGCEEVRVEICGCFNGESVEKLQQVWEDSQSSTFWRRFVVDISGIEGYDRKGHALLYQLNGHGAVFAAATPHSLDFLEEITTGISTRAVPAEIRRPAERAPTSRARHRSGLAAQEASVRYR